MKRHCVSIRLGQTLSIKNLRAMAFRPYLRLDDSADSQKHVPVSDTMPNYNVRWYEHIRRQIFPKMISSDKNTVRSYRYLCLPRNEPYRSRTVSEISGDICRKMQIFPAPPVLGTFHFRVTFNSVCVRRQWRTEGV